MATRFMSLAIFLIWTRMNSLPGSAHWPFKGFKCVNSNDQFLLGAQPFQVHLYTIRVALQNEILWLLLF